MSNTVAMYYELPKGMSELVLDKEAWVILKNFYGICVVWHRHDDKYGGGRNGPPYLAMCGINSCYDCGLAVPTTTQGFLNLVNWER